MRSPPRRGRPAAPGRRRATCGPGDHERAAERLRAALGLAGDLPGLADGAGPGARRRGAGGGRGRPTGRGVRITWRPAPEHDEDTELPGAARLAAAGRRRRRRRSRGRQRSSRAPRRPPCDRRRAPGRGGRCATRCSPAAPAGAGPARPAPPRSGWCRRWPSCRSRAAAGVITGQLAAHPEVTGGRGAPLPRRARPVPASSITDRARRVPRRDGRGRDPLPLRGGRACTPPVEPGGRLLRSRAGAGRRGDPAGAAAGAGAHARRRCPIRRRAGGPAELAPAGRAARSSSGGRRSPARGPYGQLGAGGRAGRLRPAGSTGERRARGDAVTLLARAAGGAGALRAVHPRHRAAGCAGRTRWSTCCTPVRGLRAQRFGDDLPAQLGVAGRGRRRRRRVGRRAPGGSPRPATARRAAASCPSPPAAPTRVEVTAVLLGRRRRRGGRAPAVSVEVHRRPAAHRLPAAPPRAPAGPVECTLPA